MEVFLSMIFILSCIIIILSVFVFYIKRKIYDKDDNYIYKPLLEQKDHGSYKIILSSSMIPKNLAKQDNYNITPDLVVKNKTYYRIGSKNEIDTARIESIFDSIIEMIKDPVIKENLKNDNPIYLVGNSSKEFTELQPLSNINSHDGRTMFDIKAFGTNKPLPGFIHIEFNYCKTEYIDESVVFHEFMHTIHQSGFTQEQKNILTSLYNKYKVPTSKYNINSYAFSTENEFFAVMAQVFCQMTSRLDATGNITIEILENELYDMFVFLNSIIDIKNNKVLKSFCLLCNNKHQLCCRDENLNCEKWAENGECSRNPEYMTLRCRKSCSFCHFN